MFLHGKLHEEVYLTQPPGFVGSQPPQHAWFSTFSSFLFIVGFVSSHCDSSLFIHKTTTAITVLLVYVDDILLIGSDPLYIEQLICQMHSQFSMKDLGNVSYFLGISIHPTSSGCFFLSTSMPWMFFTRQGWWTASLILPLLLLNPLHLPRTLCLIPNQSSTEVLSVLFST